MLAVINAATREEVKRLKVGEAPVGILITPAGDRAYIALMGEDRLAVVDLQSLNVTGHVNTGHGPDGMAWVPGLQDKAG